MAAILGALGQVGQILISAYEQARRHQKILPLVTASLPLGHTGWYIFLGACYTHIPLVFVSQIRSFALYLFPFVYSALIRSIFPVRLLIGNANAVA